MFSYSASFDEFPSGDALNENHLSINYTEMTMKHYHCDDKIPLFLYEIDLNYGILETSEISLIESCP